MLGGSDRGGNAAINRAYVEASKIEGNSKVGGICGEVIEGSIYNSLVNAEIGAVTDKAGGIVGYMDNKDMTAAVGVIKIYNNNVANSQIKAKTGVGGLIGNIASDLYTNGTFFYNNYVHAYLTSDDAENVSMGIGGYKEENPTIKNTYIYKYSKINDEYMNESIDNYAESQYLTSADLKLETTYKNKLGWGSNFNYTSLKNNKYPLVLNITNQEGIDLPEDPISLMSARAMMLSVANNLTNTVALATTQSQEQKEVGYDVYAISANEINIDLKNVEEGAILKIGEGEIPVKSRTYTFKYDFTTIETLKLIQNIETEETNSEDQEDSKVIEIVIKPDEVRRYTTLEGENYAYINGNKLNINGKEVEGEFIHLYEGQALTNQGEIYDIGSQSINPSINKVEGLVLEEEVKPKEEYEYQGNAIQVFGKYSTIGEQVRQQIYTVRNGNLSILSSSLDMNIGQKVIEMVNGKEYETILKTDGTLQDLKEKLTYPEDFENSGIKEINQNTDTEKPEMVVYYEDGQVVIFNYLTGEVKYSNNQKQDIGILEYLKTSLFSLLDKETEDVNDEYKEAKVVAETLEETPVNVAIATIENTEGTDKTTTEDQSISQNYITSYNPQKDQYEVYGDNEIIESEEETPESETEKIETNGLEKFYSSQGKNEKENEEMSGVVIIFVIIFGIGVCMLIGRYYLRK